MAAKKPDFRERFTVARVSPTGAVEAVRVLVQDQAWCPNAKDAAETCRAKLARELPAGWTAKVTAWTPAIG